MRYEATRYAIDEIDDNGARKFIGTMPTKEMARRLADLFNRMEAHAEKEQQNAIVEAHRLNFARLQAENHQWLRKNFPQQLDDTQYQSYALIGLQEEIGELAHAYLKFVRGIRNGSKEKIADAVGDIAIFLASFCNTKGIDLSLQKIVEQAWAEVKSRDWNQFPVNGKTA